MPGSYGHDSDRRWLQGVVQRPARGGCFIRYCDPSVEDEFGGKIQVEDEAALASFRDGDVVGVQGELLPAENSAGQNPRYRVHQVWPVQVNK